MFARRSQPRLFRTQWGVIYALHARACIERGRVWQAEHYVGAVRDHAVSLACLREGLVITDKLVGRCAPPSLDGRRRRGLDWRDRRVPEATAAASLSAVWPL